MRKGCDVSSYQEPIDFVRMKANGANFVFLRNMTCYLGSDGKIYIAYDKMFETYWENARQAFLDRGCYALIDYTENVSMEEQASHFCDHFTGGELQPVCDLERATSKWPAYPSREILWDRLKRWFNIVESRTGKKGLLYLNYSTYLYLKPFPSWFTDAYGIWIAWIANATVPTQVKWKYWQYSWQGDAHAYGCAGSTNLDMNYEANGVVTTPQDNGEEFHTNYSIDSNGWIAGIEKIATKNFTNLAVQPRYAVIHNTAVLGKDAITYAMKNPQYQASAHLAILRDGTIIQYVPVTKIAWHAGYSSWNGLTNLNKYSIGIELENGNVLTKSGNKFYCGYKEVPPEQAVWARNKLEYTSRWWHTYTEAQANALFNILDFLHKTYNFTDIVGHDDISLYGKVDPGALFPMSDYRSMVLGANRKYKVISTGAKLWRYTNLTGYIKTIPAGTQTASPEDLYDIAKANGTLPTYMRACTPYENGYLLTKELIRIK